MLLTLYVVASEERSTPLTAQAAAAAKSGTAFIAKKGEGGRKGEGVLRCCRVDGGHGRGRQ